MPARNIVLLGSSGSIGRSTLDVVRRHRDRIAVHALAVHRNVELLAEQCREFRPRCACVADDSRRKALADALAGSGIEVLAGEGELIRLASLGDTDTVVNAVVGAAGLRASLAAVEAGKNLALANKESLVAGGPLFPPLLEKTGARVLPIDSEHSALWQAMACGRPEEIRRLIITASGGPFRTLPKEKFADITAARALDHPTWKMGPKITIDSATLANKGLEVIEAVALFRVPVERVQVVVHPQSIVHSMVEFVDSSVMAQLSQPDMRLPITYALFWPERVPSDFGRLDMTKLEQLTFEPPDPHRFPMLELAFAAARKGGTAPAVYNAANEIAAEGFRNGTVGFEQIAEIVDMALSRIETVDRPDLDEILKVDSRARGLAREAISEPTC
jgi:1-deoxy-D-xylulose-5-phosphate reductoisomerase